MSEQNHPPQYCYFCERDLPLWHVMGSVYTCAYCANARKLKNLRKVADCDCGTCPRCKQREVKEARHSELSNE